MFTYTFELKKINLDSPDFYNYDKYPGPGLYEANDPSCYFFVGRNTSNIRYTAAVRLQPIRKEMEILKKKNKETKKK